MEGDNREKWEKTESINGVSRGNQMSGFYMKKKW